MKKRVCVMTWFLSIGMIIIGFPIPIGVICIIIMSVAAGNKSVPLYEDIIMIILGVSFIILLFYLTTTLIWQWVVMDENGIRARSVFVKYRSIRWEEVKKIVVLSAAYNPLDPKVDFFCFIDFGEGTIFKNKRKNPINLKGTYIKIKGSKKNRAFIEEHCPGVVFECYKDYYDKINFK